MSDTLSRILFLDIETVALYPKYDDLPPLAQTLWEAKARYFTETNDLSYAESYLQRAAIYAEFAKVVCVSMGMFKKSRDGDPYTWHTHSLCGTDEKAQLLSLSEILRKTSPKTRLCTHNGKEFDIPFLGRRYLINGIPVPSMIKELQSKKPWQNQHLDTMEMWKFGDFKNYTSLSLLAYILGETNPKEDISGADIHRVYWEEKHTERIQKYCEEDVRILAKVYLKLVDHPAIDF